MLAYDDLVTILEDAWAAAGLHEHTLVESVNPAAHDRLYRAELFPEHPEPLTEENMPPWVELTFTWSALHQLRSEGREIAPDPLELIWTYNVPVRGMNERSDPELVRLFQRAYHTGFRRFYPAEADLDLDPLAVEVRRIYQDDGNRLQLVHLHLVSANLSDLSDQWGESDPRTTRSIVQTEVRLVSAVLYALAGIFTPSGHSGYRRVDAA